MPDVGFRYPRADLLKAVADRKGVALAAYVRSLCDAALESEGFSRASPSQYALVSNGELVPGSRGPIVIASYRLAPDPRGEWLPVENEDHPEPFDAARHWRLTPEPLRVDGDRRVVRRYPVIAKGMEHA